MAIGQESVAGEEASGRGAVSGDADRRAFSARAGSRPASPGTDR